MREANEAMEDGEQNQYIYIVYTCVIWTDAGLVCRVGEDDTEVVHYVCVTVRHWDGVC